MINVGLLPNDDLNRQILLLEEYPEIAKRNYIPALKRAVKTLDKLIRPTIPSPGKYGTGEARQTFGSRVLGTTIHKIRGQVGWYDRDDPWHMNIVEHGARNHPLVSGSTSRTQKDRAAFENYLASPLRQKYSDPSVPVFIKGAGWRRMSIHPGFGGRFFLKSGYERGKPMVEQELERANEQVARELIQ